MKTIGETEHPVVFYQRIKKKLQEETHSNPRLHPLHTFMFRKVLVNGLVHPIRHRLEDVVGQLQLSELMAELRNKKKMQATVVETEKEQKEQEKPTPQHQGHLCWPNS